MTKEEKLQYVANSARNIGLFVDGDVTTLEDGSLFVGANEYGEIDTDIICFSFIMDKDEGIFISGMGLEKFPVEEYTNVQDLLTNVLCDCGFIQTWVKPRNL